MTVNFKEVRCCLIEKLLQPQGQHLESDKRGGVNGTKEQDSMNIVMTGMRISGLT